MNRPINFETLYGGSQPNFRGTPVAGLTWLDDGLHYLQRKEGGLHKVDALSGRSSPFFDPKKLAEGLARLPTIGRQGPCVGWIHGAAHEPGADRGAVRT